MDRAAGVVFWRESIRNPNIEIRNKFQIRNSKQKINQINEKDERNQRNQIDGLLSRTTKNEIRKIFVSRSREFISVNKIHQGIPIMYLMSINGSVQIYLDDDIISRPSEAPS